jgi:hypothetical protein
MDFHEANNYTNVMFAVVNFWQSNVLIWMSYGLCIQAVNRHILNWLNVFAVRQELFNVWLIRFKLSSVKNFRPFP